MFVRLLFDESKSPALTTVAHLRGIEATRVVHLGLATQPDYLIMPVNWSRSMLMARW